MRVAFDSWVLSSRLRYQGTYVYAQNLITQFKKITARQTDKEFRLFACPGAANDANSIEAALLGNHIQCGIARRDRRRRRTSLRSHGRGGHGARDFRPFACREELDHWKASALRRAADFSWDQAARETISVYHRTRETFSAGGAGFARHQ